MTIRLCAGICVGLLATAGATVTGAELSGLSRSLLGNAGLPNVVESVAPVAEREPLKHILSFRFSGIYGTAFQSNTNTWTRLSIPNLGVSQDLGQPECPVSRKLLFFDRNARLACNASVTAAHEFILQDHGLPSRLFASQRPIPKVPGAMEQAHLALATAPSQTALGPQPVARLAELGILRDRKLVLLETFPVACDVKAGSIVLRESIEVEIVSENSSLPAESHPLPIGWGEEKGNGNSGAKLLIIATNHFVPLLSSFIAHKQTRGWTVELLDTATTDGSASAIRSEIQTHYTNEITRPTHLLLVGDTDTIPAWPGKGSYRPDTDLYYACMDGTNDWLPDMAYGRFPARTIAQLSNMVARILYYETNVTKQAAFVSKAGFITSEENYSLTEGTHNSVIAKHFDPRCSASQRLYKHTCQATTSMITNAVNAGCAVVAYSGHGQAQKWLDPVLQNTDVQGLANGVQCPFVSSFACLTGAYAAYDECFAEAWLRKAWPGGAVAVLASSQDTYWEEDDVFERAVFAALFEQAGRPLGDVVQAAKESHLAHYGSGSETLQYFEQYNLFGDPTLAVVTPDELRLLGVSVSGNQALVHWQGGTAATQYLDRAGSLGPGATWVCLLTNPPPTPLTNSFSDAFQPGGWFYRVRVSR